MPPMEQGAPPEEFHISDNFPPLDAPSFSMNFDDMPPDLPEPDAAGLGNAV